MRCMHGTDPSHDGAGNLAEVYWLNNTTPDEVAATAGTILARQVQQSVTSVFVAGAHGNYVAMSFSPHGAPIQFCGHGALAAAWVVLNQHEPNAESVAFSSGQRSWSARRSNLPDADVTLTYVRPQPIEIAVPNFAHDCIGSYPVAAAEVGAITDYLILELPATREVQNLQPNFEAIAAATERALIVTARATAQDEDDFQAAHNEMPGCVFRYFAPQYGDPEDAATGSAAVQLAAYWAPRLNAEHFTAHQLSLQGGWMQLSCSGEIVELAGRVECEWHHG